MLLWNDASWLFCRPWKIMFTAQTKKNIIIEIPSCNSKHFVSQFVTWHEWQQDNKPRINEDCFKLRLGIWCSYFCFYGHKYICFTGLTFFSWTKKDHNTSLERHTRKLLFIILGCSMWIKLWIRWYLWLTKKKKKNERLTNMLKPFAPM